MSPPCRCGGAAWRCAIGVPSTTSSSERDSCGKRTKGSPSWNPNSMPCCSMSIPPRRHRPQQAPTERGSGVAAGGAQNAKGLSLVAGREAPISTGSRWRKRPQVAFQALIPSGCEWCPAPLAISSAAEDGHPSSNQPRKARSRLAIAAGSSTPITSPIAAMGTVNSLSIIS